jgi:Raf kinase inhibitor-like YbhB/YbcL family protein
MTLRSVILAGAALIAAAPTISGGALAQTPAPLRPSFLITSPTYPEFAFMDKHSAASERDCGGQNLSPALAWSGEPAAATHSFAVLFQDPDGNNGQSEGKWIGYNIAPTVHSLPEGGMSATAQDMTLGVTDNGDPGYYGPCPPYGKMHHYVYGVYALDLPVGALPAGLNREQFLKAVKGHTVAYQSIVFIYQRPLPANGIIPPWKPRQTGGH